MFGLCSIDSNTLSHAQRVAFLVPQLCMEANLHKITFILFRKWVELVHIAFLWWESMKIPLWNPDAVSASIFTLTSLKNPLTAAVSTNCNLSFLIKADTSNHALENNMQARLSHWCLSVQQGWIYTLFICQHCSFPKMQGTIYPPVYYFFFIPMEFRRNSSFCLILQPPEILQFHSTGTSSYFSQRKDVRAATT